MRPSPYTLWCLAIHVRKSAQRPSKATDWSRLFRYQTFSGSGFTAESKTIRRTCEGNSVAYSEAKYVPYEAPMKVSFRSPRAARRTSRSRALLSEEKCRISRPDRSTQPRANALARAMRSFLYDSEGYVGDCVGPFRSRFGSWQESGAERPTPRGA